MQKYFLSLASTDLAVQYFIVVAACLSNALAVPSPASFSLINDCRDSCFITPIRLRNIFGTRGNVGVKVDGCICRVRRVPLPIQASLTRGIEGPEDIGGQVSGQGNRALRSVVALSNYLPGMLQYAVMDVAQANELTKRIEKLAAAKDYKGAANLLTEPGSIKTLGSAEVIRLWRLVPETSIDMVEAYVHAVENFSRCQGPECNVMDVAELMVEVAEFLGVSAGMHAESMSMLDKAIGLLEDDGANEESLDTRRTELLSDSLSIVALVRGAVGEFRQAREALLKSIKLKEMRFGEESVQVAFEVVGLAGLARHPLGCVALVLAPTSKSEIYALWSQLMNANATTMIMLSEAKHNNRQCGQLDEALLLCRRAGKIAQKEGDKRLIALTTAELGYIYQDKGDYEMALVEASKVLDTYKSILGDEHPATATAMDSVGVVYQKLGQYSTAKKLHAQALVIKEATLGSNHVDIAPTLHNLGVCADEGDADHVRGRQWKERALTILRSSLPPLHPQIGNAVNGLGESARAAGEYNEAQFHFEEACQIFRASLGNSHPLLAAALNNLAQVHRAQRRFDEALLLMEQSVSIKKEALTPNHPSIATGLSNLAAIWEEGYKDLERSLSLRQNALEMLRNSLGSDHPQFAVHLNNLAVVHSRLGEYDTAMELYNQALAIDEAVFGARHPQVATDLNNLATLSFHIGQWQLSRQLYERALSIREEVLGESHAKTAATRRNLDLVLKQLESSEESD